MHRLLDKSVPQRPIYADNKMLLGASYTLQFQGMPRELVWIKEKSRWGCSACMWVFSAPKVLVQGTWETWWVNSRKSAGRNF
jgi:hypothetical protein